MKIDSRRREIQKMQDKTLRTIKIGDHRSDSMRTKYSATQVSFCSFSALYKQMMTVTVESSITQIP
jgi:hypothetical protein